MALKMNFNGFPKPTNLSVKSFKVLHIIKKDLLVGRKGRDQLQRSDQITEPKTYNNRNSNLEAVISSPSSINLTSTPARENITATPNRTIVSP